MFLFIDPRALRCRIKKSCITFVSVQITDLIVIRLGGSSNKDNLMAIGFVTIYYRKQHSTAHMIGCNASRSTICAGVFAGRLFCQQHLKSAPDSGGGFKPHKRAALCSMCEQEMHPEHASNTTPTATQTVYPVMCTGHFRPDKRAHGIQCVFEC